MKTKYQLEDVVIRNMYEADKFFLASCLMDPVLLAWYPMSNLREVRDSIKIWQLYARRKSAFTLEVDGKPAAMALLYINTFEKLKHQSFFAMFVESKYRSRGLGSILLKYLMKVAYEQFGVLLLHLEVYEGNPAYNLYKRHGFREYGRHKKFLRNKDNRYDSKILMQIDLKSYFCK